VNNPTLMRVLQGLRNLEEDRNDFEEARTT
jgi:hypothetical protein